MKTLNKRPFYTILITLVACTLGCEQLGEVNERWRDVEKRRGSGATYGEGVRLALADVQDESAPADYRRLLSEGVIRESSIGQSVDLSGELRKGLLASAKGRADRLGDGVVQVYTYEIDGGLPRMKLEVGDFQYQLPFALSADSTVEIARIFPSVSEARRARPISVLNIPHDTASALALPPNTVISVPIKGKLSLHVGGRFLNKAASVSRTFLKYLSASAYGSYSGVSQGTLVGEGHYRLQFIRLDGSRIRVRALSGANVSGGGSLGFNAKAGAKYTFTPASVLQRARSIRRHLETAGRHLETLRKLPERLALLRGDLPGSLDRLLEDHPELLEAQQQDPVRASTEGINDPAMDLAASANARLDQLDEQVFSRAEQELERVTDAWDTHVDPALKRIKKLSSHALNVKASTKLDGEFARHLRTVADFEYDLSDPDAALAFERAVSGRTVWRGAVSLLQGQGIREGGLADFTLSDTLATEQSGRASPAVVRHALASSDFRESQLNLSFDGLWVKAGVGWQDRSNEVRVVDSNGFETSWRARAWQHSRQVSGWGGRESESISSGSFTRASSQDILDGGYWFGWRRSFPKSMSGPVFDSVRTALNTLGPLALEVGIHGMFHGEHDGEVSADLAVLFNGEALAALFDFEETPETVLWEVLAETVDTFDNRNILPTLPYPFRSEIVGQVEGAQEACDLVAQRLGTFYCNYFADDFIPALRDAQIDFSPEVRLDFFEKFYKAGPFGTGGGSRFLVRYISALIHRLGGDEGVSVRFEIRNQGNPSEAASPSLVSGDPVDLTLLESTTPVGLR